MKRESSLIKNTIIIAFGTMLPKIANIITLPIITARLTKAGFGTYDLIFTFASLCLPIITLQIHTAAFRFLIEKEDDIQDTNKIISTMFYFICFTSLIALSILFIILRNISLFTKLLILAYFIVDILLSAIQQICRGLHQNKLYSLSAVIVSIVNMLMIVITLQLLDQGLNGILWSILTATLCSTIVLTSKIKLFEYISYKFFDIKMLKEMLLYSWPMIPNSLSNWVMNLSDRIIITGALGLEANAVYSVANKMPNLFTSVQGTFVMAWQENASIASKDEDIDTYYTSIFDSVTRILYAIMSVLIISTPILFSFLIKGNYNDAYYQMPILYVAMLFSAIASFIGGIYVALKKTRSIGITTIIAAVFNVIINFALIYKIGIFAGSISTLVSYAFLAVFRMVNIRKFVKIKYNTTVLVSMLCLLSIMGALSYKRVVLYDITNCIIGIVSALIFNQPIIKQVIHVFMYHR